MGTYQKFFGRKIFIVAKSFPRKRVPTKNFQKYFLGENFLWSENHFLENGSLAKKFRQKCYGRKIISSKTGPYQNFSTTIYGRKIFMVEKSFPRKRVTTNNFQQFCGREFFYGRKIISSKTGPYQKFSSQMIFRSQNNFLENGSPTKNSDQQFFSRNLF